MGFRDVTYPPMSVPLNFLASLATTAKGRPQGSENGGAFILKDKCRLPNYLPWQWLAITI